MRGMQAECLGKRVGAVGGGTGGVGALNACHSDSQGSNPALGPLEGAGRGPVGNSGAVIHFIIYVCMYTGRPTTQIAGIAVREYGTVIPFGPDGTYMVFERLDSAEAIKRRGSDGGSSVGSGSAATKRLRSFALLGREVCAPCHHVCVRVKEVKGQREHGQSTSDKGVSSILNSKSDPATALLSCRLKQSYCAVSLQDPSGTSASVSLSTTAASAPTTTASTSGPAFTMGARSTSSASSFLAAATAASAGLPGPGQYDVPGTALASGPAFTLRGRSRERPREQLPGPGDYGPGASRCGPYGV